MYDFNIHAINYILNTYLTVIIGLLRNYQTVTAMVDCIYLQYY